MYTKNVLYLLHIVATEISAAQLQNLRQINEYKF